MVCTVTRIYVFRVKRYPPDDLPDQYVAYLVVTIYTTEEAADQARARISESLQQPAPYTTEDLTARFKEAVDDKISEDATRLILRSNELPESALNTLASLPDQVQERAAEVLRASASTAGVNAPPETMSFGSGVAVEFTLGRTLKPVADALTGLEIVGLLLGMTLGVAPLVAVCGHHLSERAVSTSLSEVIKAARSGTSETEATDRAEAADVAETNTLQRQAAYDRRVRKQPDIEGPYEVAERYAAQAKLIQAAIDDRQPLPTEGHSALRSAADAVD
jgi:hypothetical protein